ncbi:patatin-like phospholipase family protein [Acidimangrovimonas pyrenivorans]|uniref:Patatin-like phospholipase family protein n=1 Tax=Acidimangrovimonas pyrenivorans TaxID=2030798 RepID=A0ABV7ADL8_9RHOB
MEAQEAMAVKIGLALGSGGARGWSHIGVLRALHEIGVVPDIVCGTSMGALVGGAYVSGALDELEGFARGLSQLAVARMIDLNLTSGGLIEGQAIAEALRELGFAESFAETEKPFIAVASDLYAGCEVWLREGDLVGAIRASIGIPGILSPIWKDGRWLMDGGMSNPIPVSACRALGADVIIAVNPNSKLYAPRRGVPETPHPPDYGLENVLAALPPPLRPVAERYLAATARPTPRPPAYLDVLSAAIDVMTDQIRRSRLAGDPPNVMIDVDLVGLNALDFASADHAIRKGAEALHDKASLIERLL